MSMCEEEIAMDIDEMKRWKNMISQELANSRPQAE